MAKLSDLERYKREQDQLLADLEAKNMRDRAAAAMPSASAVPRWLVVLVAVLIVSSVLAVVGAAL